jgi:hypothetical protein
MVEAERHDADIRNDQCGCQTDDRYKPLARRTQSAQPISVAAINARPPIILASPITIMLRPTTAGPTGLPCGQPCQPKPMAATSADASAPNHPQRVRGTTMV